MASSVVCTVAVQRIEVITGAGGRRAYSAEEKIRLVGEARGGRGAVAAVARRHGVCSSLIYRWRRQIRSGELSPEAASFVPVHLVDAAPPAGVGSPAVLPSQPPGPPVERQAALVEVVLTNGRVLRVGEDIAPATLRRLADVLDGR
ncbi:transposase [Nitrospirillum viridazoti CBAmc]|uniref:Transposase n=1 Tax=Nitrospirillum viridazoti CBAmc TaxID=1441467 RepID=A0A248K0R9_9PROT|nr:transposase [Nitrospirillum amazonense CBAmc]ASG24024.1 transposase [Nitrospirillum amazonense CBAmc]